MRGTREIRGRGIVHGRAEGPALVSREELSFLGDLDIRTGNVVGAVPSLKGARVGGTVLVIPHSVGSAGAWRFLYQLFVHGTAPAAIVIRGQPDSSLVQGAILAKIPIVCEPDDDPLRAIRTGDQVTVDGTDGTVRIAPGVGAPA